MEKAGFQEREITHVRRLVAHELQACQGSSDAAEVTLWYVKLIYRLQVKAFTNCPTPTLGLGFAYRAVDHLLAALGVGLDHRLTRSKQT